MFVLLFLSIHCGDFIEQIKKKSVIDTLTRYQIPDVKSFILETQCLLVRLVDFAILLFKQELVIRLLFCKVCLL